MIKWKKIFWDAISLADGILDGKTALVCGAPRELGELRHWFWLGLDVESVACARSVGDLESLIEEMHGSGHEKLVLDMERLESISTSVSDLGSVDIL